MNRLITLTLVFASSTAFAEELPANHAPVTFWLAPHVSSAGLLSADMKTNFALSLGASAYGELQGVDLGVGASWVTRSVEGVQVTAGLNYAGGTMRGLQLSGGFNYAQDVGGAQIALVNAGGSIGGAQIGLINIADSVKGTQLGLLNFADDSDTPFGLFSFVKNGRHQIAVWSSDAVPLNLGLKLGGRTLYSILNVGFQASGGKTRWLAGFGFGAHAPIDEQLYLDIELLASHINEDAAWTKDNNTLSSLRVLVGYKLEKHFSVFAGPTLNVLVAKDGVAENFGLIQGVELGSDPSETSVRMWPGIVAGFEI